MTDDLLPCPFCGGKAERIDIDDGENSGGSCICCAICYASSNVEFDRKENFIANWNRRSTLLPVEASGRQATRRCENCSHWASTDRLWGSCNYASTRDDGNKIAHATYVQLGDEKQAELETNYKFGCVAWKSLRSVLSQEACRVENR